MTMTYTLENIHEAAEAVIRELGERKVLALHGEMGMGKTTLVHAICDLLRVRSMVGSPTFSIINDYQTEDGSLFHIDLYRLEDEAEVVSAGIEECLYSDKLCLVEWPEKAISIFPVDTMHLFLEFVDEGTRSLRV